MSQMLSAREKNFIWVGITIVFCAIFTVYLTLPAWYNYQDSGTLLAGERARLAKLTAGSGDGKGEDLERLQAELQSLRREIPVAPETAEILYYLDQAAKKTGVTVGGFETDGTGGKKVLPGSGLAAVTSRVSVWGTYLQVRSFLVQTEKLSRVTYNRTVTVNENKDQSRTEAVIEFDAFVAGYGSKDLKSPGVVPKSVPGKQNLFKY